MSTTPAQRELARASLRLSDDDLFAQCDVDVFVASGPGGQHRNKTESGVRLSHRPSGLVITATERRSQLQNKGVALERLRDKLTAWTIVPKLRRATKPSRGAKERRLQEKKLDSRKKQSRRGHDD